MFFGKYKDWFFVDLLGNYFNWLVCVGFLCGEFG